MGISYWEQQQFPGQMDACVIGAGITGLQAARHLKHLQPQWNVCVLEKDALPAAASSRNAGFACFGSPSEILDDLQHMPADAVWTTVERRWKGLLALRNDLGDELVDFRQEGGFELFTDNAEFLRCANKLDELNDRLKDIVGQHVFDEANQIPARHGFSGVCGALRNGYEGVVDTGRMMRALWQKAMAEGVLVLRGVEVLSFHKDGKQPYGVRLKTPAGVMRTKRLLIAVNGFYSRLTQKRDVRPARAQVLLSRPISGLSMPGAFHYDRGYYYFRQVAGRILLGGGRNLDYEGEETMKTVTTDKVQNRLEQLLKEVILPGSSVKIEMRWSGIMGVGETKAPFAGKLEENIYAAVRLGGMGVALGTSLGREAAGLMVGEK